MFFYDATSSVASGVHLSETFNSTALDLADALHKAHVHTVLVELGSTLQPSARNLYKTLVHFWLYCWLSHAGYPLTLLDTKYLDAQGAERGKLFFTQSFRTNPTERHQGLFCVVMRRLRAYFPAPSCLHATIQFGPSSAAMRSMSRSSRCFASPPGSSVKLVFCSNRGI